ncbi:MAG: hypothetical protein QQN54_02395 [Nitrosopumilus sp.]|nr:hypothetical protein [Nitrososphaerota archaeon]
MDIQGKVYQIIYEITGIILRWDKQQLSDKEAMKEIVRTLASEVDNNGKFYKLKKEKSSSILIQKKVLAPMVIGVVFFAVLFGVAVPFTTIDNVKIVEEKQISFEQLDETPSNVKEQNNSVVEEFSNKTISKKDS